MLLSTLQDHEDIDSNQSFFPLRLDRCLLERHTQESATLPLSQFSKQQPIARKKPDPSIHAKPEFSEKMTAVCGTEE